VALSNAELLEKARAGFAETGLDSGIQAAALKNLETWLQQEKFESLLGPEAPPYRPLLEWMAEAGEFGLLLDSFYQVIPFGTGGRRGPVGIGPNRINPYTIASSVQGHVVYLRQYVPADTELKVVVAYDVRQYEDLRGLYPEQIPNPVLGLSSKDFAHIAASVYAAAGVRVYMLPDEPADFISTPELSFFIRRFGAHGGLNVSASHNHPDDNGGKFYNARGGQEVPPNDEKMVEIVETITDVSSMPYQEALQQGLIRPVTAEDRKAYIDLNLSLALGTEGVKPRIVFSPLHGTGRNTVARCLSEMGLAEGENLFLVPEQSDYRGDFGKVKFRTPNPEVPESMDLAVEQAKERNADLVLATDPDADRIGACIRAGDDFQFITGNELAVILTRYRLEALKRAGKLPDRALVIKTHVTTDLMSRIAEALGAQVIGDLLVGFKYVADILDHLERDGRFGSAKASLEDFVIAAEESHGLLLTPQIRDKDAAGAAVVLAELLAELKAEGRGLNDYLIDAYKRYGYHRTLLRSTIMQGAAGTAAIRRIQDALRSDPPAEAGGRKLLEAVDFWDTELFGPIKSGTDKSSRNLLSFTFEGGIRAVIRPSGTEPKNKIYLEKRAEPLGEDASSERFWEMRRKVDREVEDFSNAFLAAMLAIEGVRLPDYALAISDLVPLEKKQHFADTFIPEFQAQAHAAQDGRRSPEQIDAWIGRELKSYGPDARLLVAKAFRAYLESEKDRGADPGFLARQEELFFGAAMAEKKGA